MHTSTRNKTATTDSVSRDEEFRSIVTTLARDAPESLAELLVYMRQLRRNQRRREARARKSVRS